MTLRNQVIYHEIDFLLPAQRFNIHFSFVSHKSLPFIREFILRLVHLSPMSRAHIANFFGLNQRETEEAISNLIERGELTLSEMERLSLTDKSKSYFYDLGESPKLSSVQDSSIILSFDLATFSCFGYGENYSNWKCGISLNVNNDNAARSEVLVEKHFQRQFYEIFGKGYLPKSLSRDGKESPTIYTVNSVNKIRNIPLRLTTEFKLDIESRVVEREDFEQLNNSEIVHELMTKELSRHCQKSNFNDVVRAMVQLGDEETPRLFGRNNDALINVREFINNKDECKGSKKDIFLGPIYSFDNWEMLQKRLNPICEQHIKNHNDVNIKNFIWIAPSDYFWGMSQRFSLCLRDFIFKANTKGKSGKKFYNPILYVPLVGQKDIHSAKQWKYQLEPNDQQVKGIVEGFLNGSVEIMYLEDELVVVIYHLSQPDSLPVTLPVGFITIDKEVIKRVGGIVQGYIKDNVGFEKPNDCGLLSEIIQSSKNFSKLSKD